MVEHVLMEQVRLVEEEDGVDALATEFLHVAGHGVEDSGGGGRGEPEGQTQLAVEVAAAQRGVVAIGEAEARLGKPVTKRAQDARLADAGLAHQHDALPLAHGFAEFLDEARLGGRQPEVRVGNLLGEGRLGEAEVHEAGRAAVCSARRMGVGTPWSGRGGSGLVLHSDNGGPMKGATILATLQWPRGTPSFCRPRLSEDNAFSEALFRTLKCRPSFPQRPFASVEDAHVWVTRFVDWYNTEHRHSASRFVTPADRHFRREPSILAWRHQMYWRVPDAVIPSS